MAYCEKQAVSTPLFPGYEGEEKIPPLPSPLHGLGMRLEAYMVGEISIHQNNEVASRMLHSMNVCRAYSITRKE